MGKAFSFIILAAIWAVGIAAGANRGQPAARSDAHAAAQRASPHIDTIDIHAIPLGDGKISGSPMAGTVYSCRSNFRRGGAEHAGDWIEGNTWDLSKKISAEGSVTWPDAEFSAGGEDSSRALKGNGLPVGSATGIFPIQPNDPAYRYDGNPNRIEPHTVSYSLPANMAFAPKASCVPMGPVGYALNGVAIFNALDDAGRDAVAHEVQDVCHGHPQGAGEYHYHGPSPCMPHANENNALVGYALDGFGIYSMYDANGKEYTDADLDACHGITSAIEWNGKMVTMYHYVLTREYPYTVGCFRGTPVLHRNAPSRGGMGRRQRRGGRRPSPPPAAIGACSGETENDACAFTGPGRTVSGACRTIPGGTLACVPQQPRD
jgi:YHYH protein